jgi:hypothetical protein
LSWSADMHAPNSGGEGTEIPVYKNPKWMFWSFRCHSSAEGLALGRNTDEVVIFCQEFWSLPSNSSAVAWQIAFCISLVAKFPNKVNRINYRVLRRSEHLLGSVEQTPGPVPPQPFDYSPAT